MYDYPEPIEKLIEAFAKLPGIGPKTAQRLAFYVLKSRMFNFKLFYLSQFKATPIFY